MTEKNLCVELKSYPDGVPTEDNFQMGIRPIPSPADGEFVAKNHYLSLDPYLRGVISGRQIYAKNLGPGNVMPGHTVARVTESRHPDFSVGDTVTLDGGWQQYVASNGEGVMKVDPDAAQASLYAGILGMPGLTAYAGLLDTAKPVAGETVVVSAAAGPVGSMVGQLARIHGCRAVGIAGSDAKCKTVVEKFGFDACINYKTEDLSEALTRHCPGKVNVYFDNVNGGTLATVTQHLALGARVTLCGMIEQYNNAERLPGPNLGPVIGARAIMTGFVVYDHYHKFPTFREKASAWIRGGDIRFLEDRADGLDAAATHFCKLMRGENHGKSLVVITPEAHQ